MHKIFKEERQASKSGCVGVVEEEVEYAKEFMDKEYPNRGSADGKPHLATLCIDESLLRMDTTEEVDMCGHESKHDRSLHDREEEKRRRSQYAVQMRAAAPSGDLDQTHVWGLGLSKRLCPRALTSDDVENFFSLIPHCTKSMFEVKLHIHILTMKIRSNPHRGFYFPQGKTLGEIPHALSGKNFNTECPIPEFRPAVKKMKVENAEGQCRGDKKLNAEGQCEDEG